MKQLKILDTKGEAIRSVFYIADKNIPSGSVGSSTKMKNDYKLCIRVAKRIDGKIKEKTKTFKFDASVTLNKAVKQCQAQVLELGEGIEASPSVTTTERVTLNDEFEHYLDSKLDVIAESTMKDYISYYKTNIRKAIGTKPTEDITTNDLQRIVNRLLRIGKSPRTAKKLKEMLTPMFNSLVHDKSSKVMVNPAVNVKIPKFDNIVIVELTDEKKRALISNIYDYEIVEFRNIFIWLTTGRRLNEVLSLKWSDINFDASTYTIVSASNKARKDMTYTLRQEHLDALGEPSNGFVFPAIKDTTKKMNGGSLKRHWQKILERSKIENLRIHDLRHIIGGTLVDNGASLEQVASILGHSSTSITKRYSKVRATVADEGLDTFFKRVRNQ